MESRPLMDTARIAQIEALRDNAAATEGEKQAAQAAIDRILEANAQAVDSFVKSKRLIRKWPVFQANPPHCNWHVERDGKIAEDTDTRDGSTIFVARLAASLSREEYVETNRLIRTIDGYYSRFKHGLIFRYNPAGKLAELFPSTENAGQAALL